ncbi:MAG: HD domain-containing protein [Bacteroidia bacterium]|nr:HD domain-containing protein [Bacteroidia bacterium]
MTADKKIKIFNDPIYGFISLPGGVIFELINHPWFQRLRRIKQLGMTNMVYPGALHTRFHHALGAMHLMRETIEVLRAKGVRISEKEKEAASIAILLHDIGHGPFSHALEHSIVEGVSHEHISDVFMQRLNKEFKGKLTLAIRIFNDLYPKRFMHQLVSSQLDMDRLDYLLRDSFFTGVSEGVISSERIIKMLNVAGADLVVEEKGVYSIEKFIIARRLMYWQVYLHKTVLAGEKMLENILLRAKELAREEVPLFSTPALAFFLERKVKKKDFYAGQEVLEHFAALDDHDIMACVKVWQDHPDRVLATLCKWLINRNLYNIRLSDRPVPRKALVSQTEKLHKKMRFNKLQAKYFVFSGQVNNEAYRPDSVRINILGKDGRLKDLTRASDQGYLKGLKGKVNKYFICFPR